MDLMFEVNTIVEKIVRKKNGFNLFNVSSV